MSNNTNTEYLNKYWVKAPYLDQKKFFLTQQCYKDFIYTCGVNEFSYSVFRYYGYEEMRRRLKELGYTFSHKLRPIT